MRLLSRCKCHFIQEIPFMFGHDVKYLGHSPGSFCVVGLLMLSLSFLPACSRSSDSDSSPSEQTTSSSSSSTPSDTGSPSKTAKANEAGPAETAQSSTGDQDVAAPTGKTESEGSSTRATTRAEGFEQGPRDVREQRTLHLTDQFTIQPPEEGSGPFRVWLEAPLETPLQDVEKLNVRVTSDHSIDWSLKQDRELGNRFLYFEQADPPEKKIELIVESRITRRSVKGFYGATSLDDALRRRYLRRTSEIPVGKKMKELAEKEGASEPNLSSLRSIYDFVVKNSTYYKADPSRFSSSGRGSATYCLFQKQGGCTDFHALYLSMGRSIDIPTRFLIGSYLPPAFDRTDRGVAYHCWAEAHLDGRGWYSLDAAYGDLWPDLLDFYFGHLDARRVTFSRGRSIDLVPAASGKINYFIKGHIEMNGEPYGDWSRKLTYREIK